MKHVVVCQGTLDRFRVFCDWRGVYVLDNADRGEVEDYFLAIAKERVSLAVEKLLNAAVSADDLPEMRRH